MGSMNLQIAITPELNNQLTFYFLFSSYWDNPGSRLHGDGWGQEQDNSPYSYTP